MHENGNRTNLLLGIEATYAPRSSEHKRNVIKFSNM
jgi:hypothetical protein